MKATSGKWEKISNLTIFLLLAVPISLIALLVAFGLGVFAMFPALFLIYTLLLFTTAYYWLLGERHVKIR